MQIKIKRLKLLLQGNHAVQQTWPLAVVFAANISPRYLAPMLFTRLFRRSTWPIVRLDLPLQCHETAFRLAETLTRPNNYTKMGHFKTSQRACMPLGSLPIAFLQRNAVKVELVELKNMTAGQLRSSPFQIEAPQGSVDLDPICEGHRSFRLA